MKPLDAKPADELQRTNWFEPEAMPTIPGMYECTLGPGSDYVFKRRFDGENWRSPVTDVVSRIKLKWRGLVPGSIALARYGSDARNFLKPV